MAVESDPTPVVEPTEPTASPPPTPPPSPPPAGARGAPAWRLPAIAAASLLLVVLGMYAWQRSAVSATERRLGAEKAQVVAEKAELARRAGEVYVQGRKDALSLFALPLAWAVRREVNAGNLDQVDQYFTEVVKQRGFTRVVFATPNGVIKVSSDRKYLEKPFDAIFPAALLSVDQPELVEPSPGRLVMAIPILGLSERQGVVAVDYVPEPSPITP